MRVTQRLMAENAMRYMNENLERLQKLQEKVASGKEFQRASDDPSNATAALSLRSSLTASQAYLDTANVTDDWMSATDFSLQQMLDVGKRATNLTLEGINDTLGPSERGALASELDTLLQQAVEIGNTNHQDNYIFAGYQTKTKPFTLVDTPDPVSGLTDGVYDAVQYNGNPTPEIIQRSISPGQTISQNIDGNAVFSPLFSAIIAARDALNANNYNSADVQAALNNLKTAMDNVSEASTTNGARQSQVRSIRDRIEKSQIELKSLLSLKEDTNMAEAISSLDYQQTVYQAVLEVGQRAVSALSLFDMLS